MQAAHLRRLCINTKIRAYLLETVLNQSFSYMVFVMAFMMPFRGSVLSSVLSTGRGIGAATGLGAGGGGAVLAAG